MPRNRLPLVPAFESHLRLVGAAFVRPDADLHLPELAGVPAGEGGVGRGSMKFTTPCAQCSKKVLPLSGMRLGSEIFCSVKCRLIRRPIAFCEECIRTTTSDSTGRLERTPAPERRFLSVVCFQRFTRPGYRVYRPAANPPRTFKLAAPRELSGNPVHPVPRLILGPRAMAFSGSEAGYRRRRRRRPYRSSSNPRASGSLGRLVCRVPS